MDLLLFVARDIVGRSARWTNAWEGWDCIALREDSGLIFRLAKNAEADAKLQAEEAFLSMMGSPSTVAVPAVEYARVAGGIVAWHRELPGKAASEVNFATLSGDELDDLRVRVLAFLQWTHSIDLKSSITSGLRRRTALHERAERLFTSAQTNVMERRCLSRILEDPPPESATVVGHFDLNPSNIILERERRLVGIIDFLDAGYGEAADDISKLFKVNPAWPSCAGSAEVDYGRVCAFAFVEVLEDRESTMNKQSSPEYLQHVMSRLA